jgi:hypothetical protein
VERRLRIAFFILALVMAAAVAGPPAFAQEPSADDDPRAGGLLEAGVRFTSIGESTEALLGGFIMTTLGPRLAIGGGGGVLTRSRRIGGDPIYPDRGLGFGYGGLTVEVAGPSVGSAVDPSIRVLVGAGNVDLTDNTTGTRLESDNVFVVEPELVVRRWLEPWLRVGASVSYRFISGVDGIDTDATGDLQSFAFGVGVSVGPL